MKMKKPILAFVLIVLIGCFAVMPLSSFAINVNVNDGSYEVLPHPVCNYELQQGLAR